MIFGESAIPITQVGAQYVVWMSTVDGESEGPVDKADYRALPLTLPVTGNGTAYDRSLYEKMLRDEPVIKCSEDLIAELFKIEQISE